MRASATAVRMVAVATTAALALTGCLDLRSSLTVTPSDEVSGELLLVAEESALRKEGPVAETFAKWRRQMPEMPHQSEAVYDQNGLYGTRIVLDDMSFEQFNQGNALRLERAGNRITFSLSLDAAAYVRPNRSVEETRLLLQAMRIEIEISLPGKVIMHNGVLSGQTVRWKLDHGTDATRLFAQSQVPSRQSTPPSQAKTDEPHSKPAVFWPVFFGIVAVILLVALAFMVGVFASRDSSRRRGRT